MSSPTGRSMAPSPPASLPIDTAARPVGPIEVGDWVRIVGSGTSNWRGHLGVVISVDGRSYDVSFFGLLPEATFLYGEIEVQR